MTETMIVGSIAGAGLVAAALVTLIWVLMRDYSRLPVRKPAGDESAGSTAASERWRPMLRLINGQDEAFVRQQVRCPQVAAQWEKDRRRIIRLYLREVASDFRGLHHAARQMVAHSPEQFSGLVPVLFRQEVSFWRALIWIELRLSFGTFGLPAISAESLLRAMEETQREIHRAMAPARA